MKKVALAGGGTAGHIWPTVEVGKALQKLRGDLRIIYLGVKGGQEEILAQKQGFDFFPIKAGKWRRYLSISNFLTPFQIFKGFFEAKRILKAEKVNAVFTKGGFVSFPVVLAAYRLKIPVIGHESDSVMGSTNFWLSRFMRKIAVAFPKSFYSKKLRSKLFYSGIPLGEEFKSADKNRIIQKLNLQTNLPILVVTGGSLGAMAINEIIWSSLDILLKRCQIIHLTGQRGFDQARRVKAELSLHLQSRYFIFDFSYDMADILKAADLIVSRAGANTLFELAFLKKPVILIPYPYAAQDHQKKNAGFAASLGGAKVFLESKFNKANFLKTIFYLFNHPEEAKIMGEKLSSLYKKDSEKIIAKKILESL